METSRSRRPLTLLIVGAATGLLLAGSGLVGSARNGGGLPAGAVARINGELVRTDDFERTLAGIASDRRSGIDDTQRRQVLDRLIDEELLVQRGLELGLARHDRKVRGDLSAAVIASVVTEYEDLQPTDAELQAFYDEHADFFARPGRLRLRQIFCRVTGPAGDAQTLARAREAARRLRAGEAFATVREALGDRELSPLPDALLPTPKLVDYLGPTTAQAALALAAGETSEPVRSSTGYHVLQILERQADERPLLAQVQSQIVTEFRRRAGEKALRTYLDELRSRADITLSSKLP
jgi:parvulin-like peptidyl-prolyl isomerase